MSSTISMNDALLALARMMGKRVLPNGTHEDWRAYIQSAFEYAWRYYNWGWTLKSASIDMSDPGNIFMPDDFDLDGYVNVLPNANGQLAILPLDEWYVNGQYVNAIALEWDDVQERYRIHCGSQVGAINVIYQKEPPTLGDGEIPFPSVMAIGIGASIYAKQGENPTRADISQEWDEFHSELDRLVGHAERNKPQRMVKNLQDYNGTYTGNVGY